MKHSILAATTLTLLSNSIAFAQSPEAQKTLFKSYITSSTPYVTELKKKNNKIASYTDNDCSQISQLKRYTPSILKHAQFNFTSNDTDDKSYQKIKNPFIGQWIEKSTVKACDQEYQINVLAVAFNEENTPKLYPLLNGSTRVPVAFQSTATKQIQNKIENSQKCTKPLKVISTAFAGYRDKTTNTLSKKDSHAGWLEVWNIKACDQKHTVNLAVIPDTNEQYRYITKIR